MVIIIKEFVDIVFNVGINSSGKEIELLKNLGGMSFKNVSRHLELSFVADEGLTEKPLLAYDENGFLYITDEESHPQRDKSLYSNYIMIRLLRV